MIVFKHIYYHDNKQLCEEYVNDAPNYKIKLEIEMTFYKHENTWSTEYDYMPGLSHRLELRMKMWKMVGTDIYYKSSEIIRDHDLTYEEW